MADASVATVRGRFLWYELLTSDPKAAQKFYTKLIGWSAAPFEVPGAPSDNPYSMWMNGEAPVGGFIQLPEEAQKAGAPSHWLAYIGTPDVDATAAEAQKLGATVHHRMEIPTVGRFAIIADPQGAVFAAYTPAEPPAEPPATPGVGEFSWHELATSDHEAAFDFYHRLFGWEKTESMDMGPAGVYQMYGPNGETLGGMFNKTSDMPGPPCWMYYTVVPDAEAAAEKVKKSGGQVVSGPMEVPDGSGDMIVQCMDPQGAAFALHSRKG